MQRLWMSAMVGAEEEAVRIEGQDAEGHLVNADLALQGLGEVIADPGMVHHVHVVVVAQFGREQDITQPAVKIEPDGVHLEHATLTLHRIRIVFVLVLEAHRATQMYSGRRAVHPLLRYAAHL